MTLTEVKTMLERHRIPYQTAQYEDEAAYWRHCMAFPYTENALPGKVIALVIPSVNGRRDIELEFVEKRDRFVFWDLWFGGYSYEMFDSIAEMLEGDILDTIAQIVEGKVAIIQAVDLKRKTMLSDGCFDLSDPDPVFGAPGFREAKERIEGKKSLWHRLTGRKIRYDIYDWRTYRQITK